MSFTSWDPGSTPNGVQLALNEAPLPNDPTTFGEILSLSNGSQVDLLNNLPPAAAETNYGDVITLPPLVPSTSATSRSFTPARTGWYTIVIPYIRVEGVGTGLGTIYDINITVIDPLGAQVCADNRTIGVNANISYDTQLSCIGYFIKDTAYRFTVTFGQASTVLPPDPPELLGGTAIWTNVYIFPMLSSIVPAGGSPFVILP